VPKNTIFTSGGPVLVDWTGAGRGPDILMTRALIDIAFRVCREPTKVGQQVQGLRAVRRRAEARAAAALAAA
jgi:hypothetical protein